MCQRLGESTTSQSKGEPPRMQHNKDQRALQKMTQTELGYKNIKKYYTYTTLTTQQQTCQETAEQKNS